MHESAYLRQVNLKISGLHDSGHAPFSLIFLGIISGLSLETRVGSKFPFLSLIEKGSSLIQQSATTDTGKGVEERL